MGSRIAARAARLVGVVLVFEEAMPQAEAQVGRARGPFPPLLSQVPSDLLRRTKRAGRGS